MRFLSQFFKKAEAESVLLVDIGAGSVGAAYAHFPLRAPPTIAYAKRLSIEPKAHEDRETAMSRTLSTLCESLVREGAPALARVAGHGRVEAILVSISAPWQSTVLRHEKFEDTKPFTFTRKMLSDGVDQAGLAPKGKLLVDESIVGTMLNGYETHEPFGKQTTRAQVIMLASLIDEHAARSIALALRTTFHTERILSIAGSSLRYQAVRSIFPHEKNAFILDTTGPEIAISLIRRGLLVSVTELPDGQAGTPEWVAEVRKAFGDFASRYPLPRVIFVLVEDEKLEPVKAALADKEISKMWLTEDPPKLVPIQLPQLPPMKQTSETPPDTILQLMALYWKEHGHDE